MLQQWTFSKSPLLNLLIVVLIENYIMEGVRLPSSEIYNCYLNWENQNSLKMIKNAFYFNSKALLVLNMVFVFVLNFCCDFLVN